MLSGNTAAAGLIDSPLFENYQFRLFFDNPATMIGTGYEMSTSDSASLIGAMTLFLYGITPGTGHLAINASEERFNDYRTCFPVSHWKFDYANRLITVPVTQGTETFMFGSTPVTLNFPSSGVYDIQFASNWNSVSWTLKTANISEATELQPATMQTINTVLSRPYPIVNSPIPSATPLPPSDGRHPKPTPVFTPTPPIFVTITAPIPTASTLPSEPTQPASPTTTPTKLNLQTPFLFILLSVIVGAMLGYAAKKYHHQSSRNQNADYQTQNMLN
jgi:hypothetical protein